MHTGRALCEDEAESKVTLPELRGTEGCQQSTRSRGKMWNRFSPKGPRNQPCQQVDLGLLASRTIRPKKCLFFIVPGLWYCYSRSCKLIYFLPIVICVSFKSPCFFFFEKTQDVFPAQSTFILSFLSIFLPSHLGNLYSFFRSLIHPFFLCKVFFVPSAPSPNVETHYITFQTYHKQWVNFDYLW